MTTQLASLQSQELAATNGRASEMRRDAAALRRDIQEAQAHIDRLQRCYLGLTATAGDGLRPNVQVASDTGNVDARDQLVRATRGL